MKLWILHSVFLDQPFDEPDEDKRIFLGAHDSLEGAQEFARQVAEADREQFNAELREEGEAEMPPAELNWAEAYKDTANRPVLHSDTVDLGSGPFHFEVTRSTLNPRL